MKRRIIIVALSLALIFCFALGGCSTSKHGLDSKNPVTLTMWHNYGGDMQNTMDSLIDEFNSTLGKDMGIIINVSAISSSSELQETLNMIVNDDPGAPAMPDICTSYPKTAIQFQGNDALVNFDDYLDSEDVSQYVDSFIDEGRIGDGGLYVFPIAKSTEILYLNQTIFDKFAEATGATMEQLSTFEGIASLSAEYYKWSGGKTFFAADSWFNFFQVGMAQLGASIFADEELDLDNSNYKYINKLCRDAIGKGGFAIYNGYSSDLSKTGDLVCSTGSSAGVLFYGDTVTYPDNTVEKVEYTILPYPTFEGGKKVALQRGNGLMVSKSNETKEFAAVTFVKWLTQPEQNMRFVLSTGYLPVTKEAFEDELQDEIKKIDDQRIAKMLNTVSDMYASYSFFTPPVFDEFDTISKDFETSFKEKYIKK